MTVMAGSRCPGGEEAHYAHMDMNGECPWCGMYQEQVETGQLLVRED